MSCFYSLVQYALDTLGGDRLTVGIVAIDEDGRQGAAQFVEDWRRARCFGGIDTDFLESFVHDLDVRIGGEESLFPPQITLEELRELSRENQNAIRITEPTRIALSAVEWVRDYADLYVPDIEAKKTKQAPRNLTQAIIRDTKQIMLAVLQYDFKIPDAHTKVAPYSQTGIYGQLRTIPAAIRNEVVHFGSIATTLDHAQRETQSRVDSTVEAVRDLRNVIKHTPLIVITDDFSTSRISRHDREIMENQLRDKCRLEGVPVLKRSESENIADEIRKAITPSTLEHLMVPV